ncbi:MAG: sensor histidine kinase [Opitutales bacterium]
MHSVYNALMVVQCELEMRGDALGQDMRYFDTALALCNRFHEPVGMPQTLVDIENFEANLLSNIAATLREKEVPEADRVFALIREKLGPTLAVLKMRIDELAGRSNQPGAWREFDIVRLQDDLKAVFTAMSQNSNGRYTVAFGSAAARPNEYLIQFEVAARTPPTVALPEVFPDVIRDLLANARKFSPPGSTIRAELQETPEAVSFQVEDSGRGIPEAELQAIVEFGRSGSNTTDIRRMGFGGGLTKAVWITKRFGGRFWIDSKLGQGTRMRLSIPHAAATARIG